MKKSKLTAIAVTCIILSCQKDNSPLISSSSTKVSSRSLLETYQSIYNQSLETYKLDFELENGEPYWDYYEQFDSTTFVPLVKVTDTYDITQILVFNGNSITKNVFSLIDEAQTSSSIIKQLRRFFNNKMIIEQDSLTHTNFITNNEVLDNRDWECEGVNIATPWGWYQIDQTDGTHHLTSVFNEYETVIFCSWVFEGGGSVGSNGSFGGGDSNSEPQINTKEDCIDYFTNNEHIEWIQSEDFDFFYDRCGCKEGNALSQSMTQEEYQQLSSQEQCHICNLEATSYANNLRLFCITEEKRQELMDRYYNDILPPCGEEALYTGKYHKEFRDLLQEEGISFLGMGVSGSSPYWSMSGDVKSIIGDNPWGSDSRFTDDEICDKIQVNECIKQLALNGDMEGYAEVQELYSNLEGSNILDPCTGNLKSADELILDICNVDGQAGASHYLSALDDKIELPKDFKHDCPCFNAILDRLNQSGTGNWLCDIVNGIHQTDGSIFTQKIELTDGSKYQNQLNAESGVATILIPRSDCENNNNDLETVAKFIHEFLHGHLFNLLFTTEGEYDFEDLWVENESWPGHYSVNKDHWIELVKRFNNVDAVDGEHHTLFFTHLQDLLRNALFELNGGIGHPSDYDYFVHKLINTNSLIAAPWAEEIGLVDDEIGEILFDIDNYLPGWQNIGGLPNGENPSFIFDCN
jgi:hypothetical protein